MGKKERIKLIPGDAGTETTDKSEVDARHLYQQIRNTITLTLPEQGSIR